MRRITRLMALVLVLTIVCALPVFAQEVTNPEKVIKEETFNAGEEKLQVEFHNSEVWRAGYYLEYLDGVIYNLNETVRIKQEIVTNYTELAKVNPYYATLIPQAERDLAQAKSWVEYYTAYRNNAQADLKARYKY